MKKFLQKPEILAFWIFTICAAPQSEGQVEQVRLNPEISKANIKTVRLVVYQDYGNANKVNLPFEQTTKRMLGYAGVKVSTSHSDKYDAVFKIEVQGEARTGRYYWPELDRSEIRYSGAYFLGKIFLENSSGTIYDDIFSGEVKPPKSVEFQSFLTPSSAPFYDALALENGTFSTIINRTIFFNFGTDAVITALQDKDAMIRIGAAIVLGQNKVSLAVNSLIAALLRNQEESPYAAIALSSINNKAAIEPLIKVVKNKKSNARRVAISALGVVGDDRAIQPLLLVLRNDKDPFIRQEAARALYGKKDTQVIIPLIQALQDENQYVRKEVEEVLDSLIVTIKPGSKEARTFISTLKNSDNHIREYGAKALHTIKDSTAVYPLLLCLGDSSSKVRRNALIALRMVGDERIIETILPLLKDADLEVRSEASKTLRLLARKLEMGSPIITTIINTLREDFIGILRDVGDAAVEPLLLALKDENKDFRAWAKREFPYTIEHIKPGSPAINFLIDGLNDQNEEVRLNAAWALGEIKDIRTLKPLFYSLNDTNKSVRYQALSSVDSLVKVIKPGSDDVHIFIEALSYDHVNIRRKVVFVLVSLKDPRSFDCLINALLYDSDYAVRAGAARALGELKDKRATDYLISSLKDNKFTGGSSAILALGKIADPRAIESLLPLLGDKEYSVRESAIEALTSIGKPAVLDLIKVLKKEKNVYTRRNSALVLGKIKDSRAIFQLIDSLRDKDKLVQSNALGALEKITGESFSYNSKEWKKWWKQNKSTFENP